MYLVKGYYFYIYTHCSYLYLITDTLNHNQYIIEIGSVYH